MSPNDIIKKFNIIKINKMFLSDFDLITLNLGLYEYYFENNIE